MDVLLVEDDTDTRSALELLITSSKFTCQAVASRDEAAQLIGSGAHPTTILVDFMMPGMSLIEFMGVVRTALPQARVVLTSAYSGIDSIAKRMGIRYLIRKPISPDDLIKMLKTAIESGQRAAVGGQP